MFKAYQIRGHDYFVVATDDKKALFSYVYEEPGQARNIATKATAEAWDEDPTTLAVNFKSGRWFFVTGKSEKVGFRFVGKLYKPDEFLVDGTVRFTTKDLVEV